MRRPKAAVIGAGPVGCLTALGLRQRGYQVIVYEGRTAKEFAPSLDNESITSTQNGNASSSANGKGKQQFLSRSINLAISVRGLTALASVDPSLAEMVLKNSVPMYGRMIHHRPSESKQVLQQSQAYSTKGDAINSVPRLLMSKLLLDEIIAKGVEVRWQQKLKDVEFNHDGISKALLHFENEENKQEQNLVDLVVGCDGHHSKVRKSIQAETKMKVSESSIDNYYLELHIPAKDELTPSIRDQYIVEGGNDQSKDVKDNYAIDPNHLHIWPRNEFMLIALANKDGSFTSTIFAPKRIFSDHLSEPQPTIDFFANQFPDALALINEDALIQMATDRRPSPLGMVRCQSYHAYGQAILLGDSAHAMVPFYGQGLNCGLEDVRILFEMLDQRDIKTSISKGETDTIARIQQESFTQYSNQRHKDLLAINDLALANFEEMSSGVVQRSYLLRKKIDTFLLKNLPQGWWTSLYMNVTFSNTGYHAVRQREAFQTRLLQILISTTTIASLVGIGFTTSKVWSWLRRP